MVTFSSAVSLLTLFLAALSHTEAKKRCSQACPRNLSPVCGSDGVTYSNRCLLKYQTCVTFGLVTFKHDGECRKCNTFCTDDYRPVCASNRKTYSNVCSMNVAACQKGITLTVVHQGECQLIVVS